MLVTGGVSHEWLFPKVAAVAHHGGAGTSAACFRAGVPSLVTPFAVDQFEFARLTVKHGLGPGPLPQFKAMSPLSSWALRYSPRSASLSSRRPQWPCATRCTVSAARSGR